MKLTKKKVLIILIILIILFVAILLVKNYLEDNANQTANLTDEQLMVQQVEDYTSDKVIPRQFQTLYSNYDGENSKNDLYRSLNNLVYDYLPNLFKQINGINDAQILKLFEENKNDIKENLGIRNVEDFTNIVKYLQTIKFNNNQFEVSEIDTESYRSAGQGSYLSFIIKLKYENLDRDINLRVFFANMTSADPEIIYSVAE